VIAKFAALLLAFSSSGLTVEMGVADKLIRPTEGLLRAVDNRKFIKETALNRNSEASLGSSQSRLAGEPIKRSGGDQNQIASSSIALFELSVHDFARHVAGDCVCFFRHQNFAGRLDSPFKMLPMGHNPIVLIGKVLNPNIDETAEVLGYHGADVGKLNFIRHRHMTGFERKFFGSASDRNPWALRGFHKHVLPQHGLSCLVSVFYGVSGQSDLLVKQNSADGGYDKTQGRYNDHPPSERRRGFLGSEIALLVILSCVGLGIAYRAFDRSGDARTGSEILLWSAVVIVSVTIGGGSLLLLLFGII